MIEREIDIATPEGEMKTFIFHPEGDGPHPVVLYLMDAPSIRPALKDMCSRLASAGYYVMLPYLYYRGAAYREFGASDEDMHARRELMSTVTLEGAVRDAQALLAVADADPAAKPGKVGLVGFCMSGPLATYLANALPERVGMAAAIHGARYVRTDGPSPHDHFTDIEGELYFGWPDNDPTATREDMAVVEDALKAAGVRYVIDFFPDALHGFAPPGGARYDRYASEKHWERVHGALRRNVG